MTHSSWDHTDLLVQSKSTPDEQRLNTINTTALKLSQRLLRSGSRDGEGEATDLRQGERSQRRREGEGSPAVRWPAITRLPAIGWPDAIMSQTSAVSVSRLSSGRCSKGECLITACDLWPHPHFYEIKETPTQFEVISPCDPVMLKLLRACWRILNLDWLGCPAGGVSSALIG